MYDSPYSDNQKTEEVTACKTFRELYNVILKHKAYTSYSRPEPVVWQADQLIECIFCYLDGETAPNIITRACGLRAKVVELREKIK